MNIRYFSFLFKSIYKKLGIHLSNLLYFSTLLIVFFISPIILNITPISVASYGSFVSLIILAGGIAATVIAIQLFKSGIDDGSELLIISKPISRKNIIISKLLVLLIVIIINSFGAFILTLLTKFVNYEQFYLVIAGGTFVTTLIIFLFFSGLGICLSIPLKKMGAILSTIGLCFIMMVYFFVCTLSVSLPGNLLTSKGLKLDNSTILKKDHLKNKVKFESGYVGVYQGQYITENTVTSNGTFLVPAPELLPTFLQTEYNNAFNSTSLGKLFFTDAMAQWAGLYSLNSEELIKRSNQHKKFTPPAVFNLPYYANFKINFHPYYLNKNNDDFYNIILKTNENKLHQLFISINDKFLFANDTLAFLTKNFVTTGLELNDLLFDKITYIPTIKKMPNGNDVIEYTKLDINDPNYYINYHSLVFSNNNSLFSNWEKIFNEFKKAGIFKLPIQFSFMSFLWTYYIYIIIDIIQNNTTPELSSKPIIDDGNIKITYKDVFKILDKNAYHKFGINIKPEILIDDFSKVFAVNSTNSSYNLLLSNFIIITAAEEMIRHNFNTFMFLLGKYDKDKIPLDINEYKNEFDFINTTIKNEHKPFSFYALNHEIWKEIVSLLNKINMDILAGNDASLDQVKLTGILGKNQIFISSNIFSAIDSSLLSTFTKASVSNIVPTSYIISFWLSISIVLVLLASWFYSRKDFK